MLVVNCRFLSQKITGTQKFAVEICKEIKRNRDNVLFLSNPNIMQKKIARELDVKIIGNKSYKIFRFLKLPSGILWEQVILPIYLKKRYKNAKLLNLVNLAPIFYDNNFVVLHDVAFKIFPKFYNKFFLLVYNILVPIILKKAKKIFTVSNFSKNEISRVFNVDKQKIFVIYNGVSFVEPHNIKNNKDYVLSVSSLEPRKNITKLIKSFSLTSKLRLVLVGEKNTSVFSDNININNFDNIVFTGYLSDDELKKIYQEAKIFVYISLYEGFGIPPLEAQSFGIPVVLSDINVFREIYEDSVMYVNKDDENNIINVINEVYNNPKLANDLKRKGYENVKRYSWAKSTQKLLYEIEFYENSHNS